MPLHCSCSNGIMETATFRILCKYSTCPSWILKDVSCLAAFRHLLSPPTHTHAQVSCVTPLRDRSQVVPQWHKQLFKFQRIKCTKCSTSPGTIKKGKKIPHLKVMCLPGIHVMLYFKSWSCSGKNEISDCSDRHPAERWSVQGFAKDSRNGGTTQKAGKR